MNEEDLLHRAKLCGERTPEELTFGELREAVELHDERERRFWQTLSVIAYRHAVLVARALAGERLPEVGQVFPFWTEEELRQARLAHYREVMERHAGRGRKERENDTVK